MKIKLSDYLVKRLKEVYNVNNVFMVTGGGAMHLNDSFGKYIPYICNHHEQASAIAAEGYARFAQKLAVVNVTTGPGGINCLNGVFGQWTDSAPVLYISGQVKFQTTLASIPNSNLRQLGDQEVDIISVVKPLTKYAVMISNPKEVKYHLDRAIFEATTGRPGPVWLDIPIDIQASIIDDEDLVEFVPHPQPKYDMKIKEVISKLENAKRPIIVAGHGIRISKQEKAFYELLKRLNIPVVTSLNGFDVISSNHPNYIGRIGTIGHRAGNFALQNADVVLCLGTRNNIRQASYNYENFAKKAFKIVVDVDSAELNKPTVIPDMKIHADLKYFIPELVDNITKIERLDWLRWCNERQDKYSFKNRKNIEYAEKGTEINPYNFTYVLSQEMKEGDVLTMANGSASVCVFQTFEIKENQRVFLNSGNASMGYEPSIIGVCIANDKKNAVCVSGDGSLMMNLQELQTIKHYNLPIKMFIINNGGYISIKQTQNNFFEGRMVGTDSNSGVSTPDFIKVGEAFGIKSVRIDSNADMQSKIKEVLIANEPIVCEVIVKKDYGFIPKLSAKKLDDGTMVSPTLEDMFPFLDKEEFEKNIIKD